MTENPKPRINIYSIDSDPNESLPFVSLNAKHELLSSEWNDESNVYAINTLVTGTTDYRTIVYKELRTTKESLPPGVDLVDYAKGLNRLFGLIHKYYPEAISTSYILAKNHDQEDCVIAIQPYASDPNGQISQSSDPSLQNEISSKQAEFRNRFWEVKKDPLWKTLPGYILEPYKNWIKPDFNLSNFVRSKEGKYTIIDW